MTTEPKKPEAKAEKKALTQGEKLDLVIALLERNGMSVPKELKD